MYDAVSLNGALYRTRAYAQRIVPYLQQAQPALQDVLEKTAKINSALGARAQATLQTSKEYSEHLVEQLKHLAEQGKELPSQLIDVSARGGVEAQG